MWYLDLCICLEIYVFYTDVCKELWALESVGKLCECESLNLSFLICKMEMVSLSLKLGRIHSLMYSNSEWYLLSIHYGDVRDTKVKSLKRTNSIPALNEGDRKGNDIQKAPGMGAWYTKSAQ